MLWNLLLLVYDIYSSLPVSIKPIFNQPVITACRYFIYMIIDKASLSNKLFQHNSVNSVFMYLTVHIFSLLLTFHLPL